ncbi:unnamed protein product [Sphagnum troendelagicum]|uniref:Uncharacterized protein n=1 Tax=Sphagnum troendelagicum TaxID=128251 RepID=A0ABP0TR13_9BRYO
MASVQKAVKKKNKNRAKNAGQDSAFRGKPVSTKWKPVWGWLHSLDRTEVVEGAEILEWLNLNAQYAAWLRTQHSNSVLVSYIQKCHHRLLFGREYHKSEEKKVRRPPAYQCSTPVLEGSATGIHRLPNGQFGAKTTADGGQQNQSELAKNVSLQTGTSSVQNKDTPLSVSKHIHFECCSVELTCLCVFCNARRILNLEMCLKHALSRCKGKTYESCTASKIENQKRVATSSSRSETGTRGQGGPNTTLSAWAYSEASIGKRLNPLCRSECSALGFAYTSRAGDLAPSIVEALWEREIGGNSGTVAYRPRDVGSRGKRWNTVLKGWDSLGKQQIGPVNWLQKRAYSSWVPSWAAYTSSIAIAQPLGSRIDQGIQKVLDVRFHPGGAPQLVVSCNEPPNELLLYNLVSGRARELIGHNSQIQAVEFALGGDYIVSCASNIVKVWDSTSAACLHTLGPGTDDGTAGHKKKISAMAVNQFHSCLAATSGGEGDSKLLLWNILRGELVADLNAAYRQEQVDLPSMDALKICNGRNLICGSDSPGGKPAVVQIWDIDALSMISSVPAHDTYITCLDTNVLNSTLITGAGDGTVGLFDVRTAGAISRLPLSSSWEITSVSFSSCETYFQASCTGNCTFVWDTRMMSLEPGPKCTTQTPPLAQGNPFRALHQLSHGAPMPTSENSFQVPGYVDIGDQGVNDARWFQQEPILVTVSGNGSVAMWDVSLGQPCIQHIASHSRCINTVAVSPKDQFICTGGDDQKVVLYQDVGDESQLQWRLTHPLWEEPTLRLEN